MKLARIETNGNVIYASVEETGYRLVEGDIFGKHSLSDVIVPMADAKLLTPIVPPQIICIGANYRKHCAECNVAIPERPVVFFKQCNVLCNPGQPVELPKIAPNEVDYEAELAIVIGKTAKHVSRAEAKDYILGYTCANDVSARDVQIKQDILWDRGKSFDTFCPLGPWIDTEADGQNLSIKLMLNGEVMQDACTDDMIFPIDELVEYLSDCMTLYPGAVILTGTPWGVGMGRTPQVFLKEGDEMTVEIESIGRLTNPVITEQ